MALPPENFDAEAGLPLDERMSLGDAMEPGDVRQAPTFPAPEPLKYGSEEAAEIVQAGKRVYSDGVSAREKWAGNHKIYDQMFRGQVEEFSRREGPWEGSSHLHVQMPYWLVDALNARLVHTIWNQNPLVQAMWEEDGDAAVAKKAARLVEWHLQPKRMNAREAWSRASKIRLIHGSSFTLVSWAHDTHTYRVVADRDPQMESAVDPYGMPMIDEVTGEPVELPDPDAGEAEVDTVTETLYQGPVVHPLEWDDVVLPVGAMNCQPKRLKNPGGSDWVFVRSHELFSDIKKKFNSGVYPNAFDDDRTEEWWLENASASPETTSRDRQQDNMEGVNRSQAQASSPEARPNPEFEILTWMVPWEHPDTGEEEEMVFYFCKGPDVFLGGFLLTDLVWTGERPLVEKHYQTISNRVYSMGVMEICRHLSEELDTLHNMRVDVGTATNLPWYFVRASSYINPNDITLRPLELVPIDDPRDVVAPQVQNVTAFYYQEEQLLLSIIERVMGITDLFLGVSPSSGASARHATGFLGTKQEAEARLSQPLAQDSESFSQLCRLIYNLEMQWGPIERNFRLEGMDSEVSRHGLTRDDLWFRGQYDFRLGANVGMMAQTNRFERAQQAFQILSASPLVNQDQGRMWEVTAEMLRSMGYRDYEIQSFIGPKNAVASADSKSQDEEIAEMIQHVHGPGNPAPISPSDNDQDHIDKIREFLNGPIWPAVWNENAERAISRHSELHTQAIQLKQMQEQAATAGSLPGNAGGGQAPGAGGGGPAGLEARAMAQIPDAGSLPGLQSIIQGIATESPGSNGAANMPPPQV